VRTLKPCAHFQTYIPMCKTILDHPKREQIDAFICETSLSFRELSTALKNDFGLNLTPKTLCVYKNEYFPELTTVNPNFDQLNDTETNNEPDFDFSIVDTIQKEHQSGNTGMGSVRFGMLARIEGYLLGFLERELESHAKRKAKLPAEYISKLQTALSMIEKARNNTPAIKIQTENEK
jgi:hypothetical protein